MNRGRVLLSDITNKFNRSRDENDHVHLRTVQNTKIFTWTRRVLRKNVVTTDQQKKHVSWCLARRKITVNM